MIIPQSIHVSKHLIVPVNVCNYFSSKTKPPPRHGLVPGEMLKHRGEGLAGGLSAHPASHLVPPSSPPAAASFHQGNSAPLSWASLVCLLVWKWSLPGQYQTLRSQGPSGHRIPGTLVPVTPKGTPTPTNQSLLLPHPCSLTTTNLFPSLDLPILDI